MDGHVYKMVSFFFGAFVSKLTRATVVIFSWPCVKTFDAGFTMLAPDILILCTPLITLDWSYSCGDIEIYVVAVVFHMLGFHMDGFLLLFVGVLNLWKAILSSNMSIRVLQPTIEICKEVLFEAGGVLLVIMHRRGQYYNFRNIFLCRNAFHCPDEMFHTCEVSLGVAHLKTPFKLHGYTELSSW